MGGGLRATCIAVGHDVVEEGGLDMLEVLREQLPCSLWQAIWLLTPPSDEAHLACVNGGVKGSQLAAA